MIILGISCYYHDAAAVILKDGIILAAAEEERFSRIKHDSSFPKFSIDFCLKQTGLKIKEIDWVVFYEKPFLKFERITLSSISTAPNGRGLFVDAYKTWLKQKLWIKSDILSSLKKIDSSKILFVPHHISHAASSYYSSPFQNAAIFTCDGVGEWTTTTWGEASGSNLEIKQEIKFPHSLGLFYSTFTQFLGFEINEGEFKVMGLSPYGQPKYIKKIEKLIKQEKDGSYKLDLSYFNFHTSTKQSFSQKFIDLFGVKPMNPKKSENVEPIYADIAASAQVVLEDKVLAIAKYIRQQTENNNLCYSGGVALNGVANWRIFKEAGFANIYIHPASGDSGGALGAALYLYHHILKNPKKKNAFPSVYMGQKNEDSEIKKFLTKNEQALSSGNRIKVTRLSNKKLEDTVAKLLAEGKVIGWVKDRFEWGPRALGARSILADPRDSKMKDIVNSKIKFREGFRPFAPVTLYEKAREYFEIGDEEIQPILEYMLAVVPVKKKYRKNLGAITHVDGTARPQFIKKAKNPSYYNVIKKFGQITGIPVLLNTSFNLKGEPIVNTPSEAYNTFMKSGLDYLVLENYLIKKEQ